MIFLSYKWTGYKRMKKGTESQKAAERMPKSVLPQDRPNFSDKPMGMLAGRGTAGMPSLVMAA
jgi:hypothetical protein